MLKDNFNLAYKNIRERLSRSILTLLGISIGIMSIISLMAIGEGMQSAITGELSSLSDTIIVSVGSTSVEDLVRSNGNNFGTDTGEYLTERDIADIERIQGVKDVNTQLSGYGIMRFNGEDVSVSLTGVEPDTLKVSYSSYDLEAGVLLNQGDQNKCIIGYSVAHDYFKSEITVGSRVLINGQKIIVTGIFAKVGSGGIRPTDSYVILSSRDFKKITGQSNITSAVIEVYDVNNVAFIADEVEQTINENHGMDDFATAISMSSLLDTIENVIGIVQLVLVAIASIALVVASIGIMNTMLTSVMERTREIGIMKAIGAANKDIMLIFIIEGMLVSIVGGVFGIILGVFGAQGLTTILGGGMLGGGGGGMSLTPIITITSVVLAVGVSLIVGVLSSLYPAWKAARMSPIEAVRYE